MLSSRSRVDQTTPIWRLHRTIICIFTVHFNLHIYCTVSERQRVKGDWGRELRPNFALFSPVQAERTRIATMWPKPWGKKSWPWPWQDFFSQDQGPRPTPSWDVLEDPRDQGLASRTTILGWLPKSTGIFLIQRYICGKIFTEIRSVVYVKLQREKEKDRQTNAS